MNRKIKQWLLFFALFFSMFSTQPAAFAQEAASSVIESVASSEEAVSETTESTETTEESSEETVSESTNETTEDVSENTAEENAPPAEESTSVESTTTESESTEVTASETAETTEAVESTETATTSSESGTTETTESAQAASAPSTETEEAAALERIRQALSSNGAVELSEADVRMLSASSSAFRNAAAAQNGVLTAEGGKIGTIYYSRGGVGRYFDDIYVLKINGKIVICLEPMTEWLLGTTYTGSEFSENETLPNTATHTPGLDAGRININRDTRLKIEKIFNFGYTTLPTRQNLAFTQAYVWETLGVNLLPEGYIHENRAAYDAWKVNVDAAIAAHKNTPSWTSSVVNLKVGESVVLEDTNGVFSKLLLPETQNGLTFEKLSATKLKITASKAYSGAVTFKQDLSTFTAPVSLIYKRPGAQTFGSLSFRDPVSGLLNINVAPNLGSIELTKLSSEGGVLANAEYELLLNNVIIATQKTGLDGKLRFVDLNENNAYIVREKNAPKGYVLSTEPKTVAVTAGKVTYVEFTNVAQKGRIELFKQSRQHGTNLLNSNYALDKAEFGVYHQNNLVGTIITDINGYGVLDNLALLEYLVKEHKAPQGFLKTDNVYVVTLSSENQTDAVFTKKVIVKNDEVLGRIKIVKKDHEIDRRLEGAVFNILDENRQVVDTVVTDKNGEAWSKLLPLAVYGAEEIKAPKGYIVTPIRYTFDLAYKDQLTAIVEVAKTISNIEENPKIGTTLTGENGEKAVDPLSVTTLIDTVKITGAIIGKWYDIDGLLKVVETKEDLMYQGKPVTASTRVQATATDFEVKLSFVFDARELRGQHVVAFETLSTNGRTVAVEAKIDNPPQTVRIRNPRGETFANVNGQKVVFAGQPYTVEDLFKYYDVTPGAWYEIVATIGDVTKREELLINGKVPTQTLYFQAKEENGDKIVPVFLENTDNLNGKLVVLEDFNRVLTKKENPTREDLEKAPKETVIEHRNYEDKNQQFEVVKRPNPTPNIPTLPNTGEAENIVTVLVAALSFMAAIYLAKKREDA
ncbi:MAG: SpaA isopeptide-forming pilin-related protein [Aerococcaceae bacterium]|nr:SpaA isopeptide-forming pilin-related protein [Aerococcaceae bacterium]